MSHHTVDIFMMTADMTENGRKVALTTKHNGYGREWITHVYNTADDTLEHGHYGTHFTLTMQDYLDRCKAMGIDPTPEIQEEQHHGSL